MEEKNCITFLWKIENLSHCVQEKGEHLDSPEFYAHSLAESSWKLRLFPRGEYNDNELDVYLCNNSLKENCVLFIDNEISFLSANGSPLVRVKEFDMEVDECDMHLSISYPTIDEIIETTDAHLPQNTMTLRCRIWKSRNTLTQSINYFACTRIGIQQRTCHLKVAEFSKLKTDERKYINSIIMDDTTFFTEMFFTDVTVHNATIQFDIDIHQMRNDIPKLFATGKISVLDASGQTVKSMKGSHWFKGNDETWHVPQFLTINEVMSNTGWRTGDTLNLLLDLTFSTGAVYCNIERISSVPTWVETSTSVMEETAQAVTSTRLQHRLLNGQSSDESLAILQVDLLSLYHDRTLSDFELRSGNVSVPVHKSVLAARSPVFKAMFTNGMKETEISCLDIPDVDSDTLSNLLRFIYTGTVKNLEWSSAYNLYYAADKYDILSLKQKCSSRLANSITSSNACEILILADRHNDEKLLTSTHDFLVCNDERVICSPEWKQFLVENTKLAAETLHLMYSKKLGLLA